MRNQFYLAIAILSCYYNLISKSDYQEGFYYITFKEEVNTILDIKTLLGNDFEVIEQSLKPVQTYKYNQDLRKKLLDEYIRFASIKNVNSYNYDTYEEKLKKLIAAEEPLLKSYKVKYLGDKNVQKIIFNYKKNKHVENIEPVPIFQLQSNKDKIQYIPNDPLIANQKMLTTIKAYQAWNIEAGNSNVVIGVSDAGAIQNHEDLKDNIFINDDPINDIDDDKDGYIDNYNGYNFAPVGKLDNSNTSNSELHGMEVIGIAGATHNNAKGISGVAGKCKVFPIKVVETNGSSVVYGYESIIYAAVVGLKVLNCSWANVNVPNFSAYRDYVCKFAISRDVAIVAAAGNIPFESKENRVRSYMPAFYGNVLGVGEVDQSDLLTDNSALGQHCKILAPGIDNMSLTSNSYRKLSNGTSYSSPVVAGALGIVRAKYPSLNAEQSIAFIRQCTDDISALNTELDSETLSILPGRLNLLKAVTIDPMTIAGLKFVELIRYKKGTKEQIDFSSLNTEFDLYIRVKNLLSPMKLNYSLKAVYGNKLNDSSDLEFVTLSNEAYEIQTNNNNELEIGPFSVKLNRYTNKKILLKLQINDGQEYKDELIFDFYSSPEMIDYNHDKILYSLGRNGTIGYNFNSTNMQGRGFYLREEQDGLFKGGLIATDGVNVVSANEGKNLNFSDLIYNDSISDLSKKQFTMDTKISENDLRITLLNNFKFERNAALLNLEIENKSPKDIPMFAFGTFIDWDAGSDDNGYTKNLGTTIDKVISNDKIGGSFIYREGQRPHFATAVFSVNEENEPASAIFLSPSNLGRANTIKYLMGGVQNTVSLASDIATVSGVKFKNGILANQKVNCVVCITAGENIEETKMNIENCIKTYTSILQNEVYTYLENSELITISSNSHLEIELIGLTGHIFQRYSSKYLDIEKASLESGFYLLKINHNGYISTKKIVVVR